jgi:hypothetical protein
MQEITPAQKAQAKLYIMKYTAIAMRQLPQGTADHAVMADAAKKFMMADPDNRYTKYEWIKYDKNDPYLIERFGEKNEHQDLSTFYIITGHWDEILDMLRHPNFYGKENVSDSLCLAQHSAHCAADAMFRMQVLGQEGIEETSEALDSFIKNVGVAHIYANAIFVCEPPVAHQPTEVGNFTPLWTNAEAFEAGLTDKNGVPL